MFSQFFSLNFRFEINLWLRLICYSFCDKKCVKMNLKEFYSKIINNFIEAFSLDINLWLIKYGLMTGHLHDGTSIEVTENAIINQRICILLCLFTSIKWMFLIFQPEESQIVDQLGDWSPFFGPKVILDAMLIISSIHSLAIILLFNVGSRNPKRMFYWLDSMEYDPRNRNFPKMNLNDNDSKILFKRFTLTLRTAMGFNYLYIIFYGINSCILAYLYRYEYFFQYFISILLFDYQITYMVNHVYGLIIISYQVFYYFQLKFHNLNVKAKHLLNRKSNRKLNRRLNYDAFKLIKNHNDICMMLNNFNHFWKYLLTIQVCFYVILTWLFVYVNFFYSNLDFLIKIILSSLMLFFVGFISGIVFVIFSISIKVIIKLK